MDTPTITCAPMGAVITRRFEATNLETGQVAILLFTDPTKDAEGVDPGPLTKRNRRS